MALPTYRTTVSERDGITAVTFHNTAVVVFDANTITLNSDGWQTVTTKRPDESGGRSFWPTVQGVAEELCLVCRLEW